jgi:hypothetical protein
MDDFKEDEKFVKIIKLKKSLKSLLLSSFISQ